MKMEAIWRMAKETLERWRDSMNEPITIGVGVSARTKPIRSSERASRTALICRPAFPRRLYR
ncbi:hypothetical protein [Caballeronia sp. LZ019]|uniref:hypothetical protein n=1 Tax=Caballeronia sp. LZ019 TaxID=3038555 RepID=UPI00285E7255|nr:hypothetical protein [Caballeronia sp. LZ019]MDR5809833.1 hypothetical protein [Caballeronia sp. LZ019]